MHAEPTTMCQEGPQESLLPESETMRSREILSGRMPIVEEEMPHLQNVQMIEPVPLVSDGFSPRDLKTALKEMAPHSPIQRRESEESSTSKKSAASTADLTSLGESSFSSLVSNSRLYGREQEEAILKSTFEEVVRQRAPRRPKFLLISGAGGTGKTRLGESLRAHVTKAGGYFCSGKFDQHQDDQFAPLCASFNSYVMQILQEDEETIRAARRRIRSALEGDLCSLIKMIPPLKLLMRQDLQRSKSNQDECTRCNQKQGRSIFALHKLMRSICSPERPMVMLLDDIQWATRCPLQKWRAMINDDMNEGIMFVGICRNDVAATSEASSFLRNLEEQDHIAITNVNIGNLQKEDIEDMINEILLLPADQAQSLASFVFNHSMGNLYFVVETLRLMQHDSAMIKYNHETKTWIVDQDICNSTRDFCPHSFIVQKLRSLPRDIQKVVMAASCLGSNITKRLLEVALQEDVEERFNDLVSKGKLVYNSGRGTYAFKQNAIQTACYDLIGEALQPAFHLEIGLRLWKHLTEEELDDNLFLVLNQLQQGGSLIRDQKVRYDVAAMCINAAEKAAARLSFPTASSYLQFAFEMLGPNHWEEAYDLSLVLYNYSAEVDFAQGDSPRVDRLLDDVLSSAKEFQDKIRAYTTRVYVLGARGNTDEAISIGICCLKMLGVNITPRCHKFHLALSSARVARMLQGKSDPMIKRLPRMQDTHKLASMQILNMLFLNTYLGRKELFPFVVLKMMKLTLTHGLSAISSVAFAGYGALLCHSGKIEEGLRFGMLALDIVEEWNAQSFQSRVGAFVWGSIFVHARPFTESLEKLKEGYHLGLQTGDLEFALQNGALHTVFLIDSGNLPMSVMIRQLNEFNDLAALHGHPKLLDALSPMLRAMEIFSNFNGSLTDHGGITDCLKTVKETRSCWGVEVLYNTRLFFYLAAGEYEEAVKMIDGRNSHAMSQHRGSVHETFNLYADGLACFAQARRTKNSHEAKALVRQARECMSMLKLLARSNPAVSFGKCVLLEAENAVIEKKYSLAEEKYNHAASLAKKYGSNFELAFSKQTAAEYFLYDRKDKNRAISYFEEAVAAYEAWEGEAAVTHLNRRISLLRAP